MSISTNPSPALRSGLTQPERLSFARRLILFPVLLFCGVAGAYAGLAFLTLAAPWPVGLLLAPLCGLGIVALFVIGHDACHNSFTRSPTLNQVIGRLAFLPSLHGFSLWDLGHNRMHHGYNNVRGQDKVWEPWSPGDYRRRGPVRRALYRFHRSPGGAPFYYFMVLWWSYLTFSAPEIRRTMRPRYVADTALWAVFFAGQIWAAITVGAWFGHGAAESVTVAVIIPFAIWNGLMSLTIYVHHTHPSIRWYPTVEAWRRDQGVLRGTAHVHVARVFDVLILSIMKHHAHHAAPGVPLYNLSAMQRMMETREPLLNWHFSWRRFVRVCKRCQLYDYDLGRWVSFADAERDQPIGRPAAPY